MILTVTCLAIGAVAIAVDACLRVGKVFLVTHNADDRHGILIAGLDVATGDRHAWEEAVLEKSEHIVRSVRDAELAVFALLTGYFLVSLP